MATTRYIVDNVSGQTINGESILPKYKVYTALLTQSGGDNFQSQSSGPVQKGVTYYVDGGVIGVTDFSNVGGKFQTPETGGYYFVATVDGVPNEYGAATADYNTGAPVVTVLENTIGNIWFEFSSNGRYVIFSNSLFTTDKTFIVIGNAINNNPGELVNFYNVGDSSITLWSLDNTGAQSNNILLNTPIEIRVYN